MHNLINITDIFAAQGGALCKRIFVDSGQFMQNPHMQNLMGGPYFGAYWDKSSLKATSLRHLICPNDPSKYDPSNPVVYS